MSATAKKRLQADLKKMYDDPPPGIHADLSKDNLFEWDAIISGPGRTCFEGGIFRLKVKFPENYPESAPIVWFYSRMFHPNVYPDGKICIDLLQSSSKWSREYDISTVLVAIQALLGDPNPRSPANRVANELFTGDKAEYERRVKQIVFWSENDDSSAVGRNFNDDSELATRVKELNLTKSE